MLASSPVFRYTKPLIFDIERLMLKATVLKDDYSFIDSRPMAPMNRAMFDVIRDADGVTLNRAEGFQPDYWFANGSLVTREPGQYLLRIYRSIAPFEAATIKLGKLLVWGDGDSPFKSSVPFWPQILSQPEKGIARVSNDGQGISYVSQDATSQESFSYRLVNAYGQVSEPACVRVTPTIKTGGLI
ncbi:hypothetical protein D3C85_509840 [compost metagenome]